MEPSSTPSGASRRDFLRSRDERQAAMDRWLGAGEVVIAASLAVPGPHKLLPGATALFRWAVTELGHAAPRARRVHRAADALGPFVLWCTPDAAVAVKRGCVRLEAAVPAARLVDLDVYSPEGTPVDRASLDLPARTCLCCGEPAKDCIRARRHRADELVAAAQRLLAGFRRA
jgi:holo-ACP synthase CitX